MRLPIRHLNPLVPSIPVRGALLGCATAPPDEELIQSLVAKKSDFIRQNNAEYDESIDIILARMELKAFHGW